MNLFAVMAADDGKVGVFLSGRKVGNVLKLTDKASISDGSTKIAMAQEEVYSTVTILGDLLKTMNINLDFKWSYSKYTAGAYEADAS